MARSMPDFRAAGTIPMVVNPLSQPIRLIQTFILFLCGLWEWSFDPPTTMSGIVTATVFQVLLLGAGVFPVPCNVLLLVNFCVTCLGFHIEGPSQLLGVAYALGTLTYDSSFALGATLSVPVVAALAYQSVRYPDFRWFSGYSQVPILIMLLMLLLFFSHISRQRSQLFEAQRKIEEAETLRQRVKVARIVHDSVTGDLSNISRFAQQQIRHSESEQDREAWGLVNDRAMRVLDSVYAVIRQLSAGEEATDPAYTQDDAVEDKRKFVEVLRDKTDEWAAELEQSGFNGECKVIDHVHGVQSDDPDDIQERRACVLAILDELFANIIRHGRPGDEAFTVVVTVEKNQIEIVSANPLLDDKDEDAAAAELSMAPTFPGGHGLRMHREETERLGGVFSADAEEGQWILYARVPRQVSAR